MATTEMNTNDRLSETRKRLTEITEKQARFDKEKENVKKEIEAAELQLARDILDGKCVNYSDNLFFKIDKVLKISRMPENSCGHGKLFFSAKGEMVCVDKNHTFPGTYKLKIEKLDNGFSRPLGLDMNFEMMDGYKFISIEEYKAKKKELKEMSTPEEAFRDRFGNWTYLGSFVFFVKDGEIVNGILGAYDRISDTYSVIYPFENDIEKAKERYRNGDLDGMETINLPVSKFVVNMDK